MAINKDDTLSLKIDATSEMRSDYEIEILKVHNKYFSNCKLTYAVTDCTWKVPMFKSVYQNISLDKEKYNRGDNLKGEITLLFLDQRVTEESMKLDTIKVNGSIKTVVQ